MTSSTPSVTDKSDKVTDIAVKGAERKGVVLGAFITWIEPDRF